MMDLPAGDEATPPASALPVLAEAGEGEHAATVRGLAVSSSAPVALVVPAMGVPARYYVEFVRNLHEQGFSVAIADLRGQGESRVRAARGVHFGYRHIVEQDLDAVVAAVQERFPAAPTVLVGHSLGGHVSMLYAARNPERVHAVVLVASGSVWFRSFPPLLAARYLLATQLVAGLSRVLGYWPGHWFGFGGKQAVGLMRDWARAARTGRYELGGSKIDYEAAFRGMPTPVLAISVDGDDLSPPSAVRHLSGKARMAPRTRRHYGPSDAGSTALGHFNWVRHSATLAGWIREWVHETPHPARN